MQIDLEKFVEAISGEGDLAQRFRDNPGAMLTEALNTIVDLRSSLGTESRHLQAALDQMRDLKIKFDKQALLLTDRTRKTTLVLDQLSKRADKAEEHVKLLQSQKELFYLILPDIQGMKMDIRERDQKIEKLEKENPEAREIASRVTIQNCTACQEEFVQFSSLRSTVCPRCKFPVQTL